MALARISLLALLVLTGCGSSASQSNAPYRSPSHDYPPPPVTTPDGEVVGADRIPPSDELLQGARVGTEGVQPSEGPAGTPEGPPEQSTGVTKPKPCADIGLEDSRGNSRCKKPAAK